MTDMRDAILERLSFADEHGLLDDLHGRSIKVAVLEGCPLPSDIEELHRRCTRVERQAQLGQLTPFRPPRLSGAGICLGSDHTGHNVHHDLTAQAQHFACVGSTGAGKTSVWIWYLLQLFRLGIGFLGIELYKRDLRRLVPLASRLGRTLTVLTHRDLRWNPLEPDGLDPHRHLESALSSLSRCIDLPDRAGMLLRQAGHEVFAKAGMFTRRGTTCPTLFHVFNRVKTMDANAASREALLDRLGGLLTSLGPGVLGYHHAWRPSQLIDKLVVLELAGASETIRQWLPSAWLFTLFHGQVERGAFNERLRHLTLIDDAQRFIVGDGLGGSDLSPIGELLGLLRSSGLAVGANFQSLAPVPASTFANLNVRIIGLLGSYGDVRRVSGELALNPEQTAWIQHHLRAGRYLMQLNNAAWRYPFIVNLPRPRLPSVAEGDLAAARAQLDQLPVVEAVEFRNWTPWDSAQASASGQPASSTEAPKQVLTDHERRFLKAIVAHPLQSQSAYPKLAGMKPADAKAARLVLVSRGLIVERKVSLNARGRQPTLLEATDAGRELAADL